MLLCAISKFTWNGKEREINQLFDCPNEVVAKRLISEGNAREFSSDEPSAHNTSEPITALSSEDEISENKPLLKKSKVSKKKKG